MLLIIVVLKVPHHKQNRQVPDQKNLQIFMMGDTTQMEEEEKEAVMISGECRFIDLSFLLFGEEDFEVKTFTGNTSLEEVAEGKERGFFT